MNTNRIPIALHQAVMRSLRDALQLANQTLNSQYPEPTVSYQQRGATAGTAWLQQWAIRLNPVLLLENQHGFIDEVVPHELAHLLVYARFGRVAPHGKEWRWMMEQVLRVSACRTHDFNTDSVRGKSYPYRCACQQHDLSVRRHHRVQRGDTTYRCRVCGEVLQFDASTQA